jgi:hypothetical protein
MRQAHQFSGDEYVCHQLWTQWWSGRVVRWISHILKQFSRIWGLAKQLFLLPT